MSKTGERKKKKIARNGISTRVANGLDLLTYYDDVFPFILFHNGHNVTAGTGRENQDPF